MGNCIAGIAGLIFSWCAPSSIRFCILYLRFRWNFFWFKLKTGVSLVVDLEIFSIGSQGMLLGLYTYVSCGTLLIVNKLISIGNGGDIDITKILRYFF